jgi:Fic family protein
MASGPVTYHLDGFPPDNINWAKLVSLIGKANAALARYDGILAAIPNPSVLLSPMTTQEAVLSSRIEGTNVTMGEVLEIEAGINAEVSQPKREDAEEIRNYRRALNLAAGALTERPLTPHLLREAHAVLMDGVRGRDKQPGSFRDEQNWIGQAGRPIEDASFVPIPQAHLLAGLDRWASYAASRDEPDPIVQLAIVHAEFEALHPFKDGNGRLGRMIIPLFLYERRILRSPNFYMSGYLEKRRDEYVEHLRAVSRDRAWTAWTEFFLQGLIEQAAANQTKAEAILALHRRLQHNCAELTRSQFSTLAVDYMFSRPIFSSSNFIEFSQIPRESAIRIMRLMRNAGILRVLQNGSGRRASVLAFAELVNVAEGRTVF